MEQVLTHLDNFSAAVVANKMLKNSNADISTITGIKASGFDIISAKVPGNTELDMIAAGLIDFDPFFGSNMFKMQDYENIHTIYFTTFDAPEKPAKLCFDGIDTIADIYINGKLIKSVENMFIGYEIPLENLKAKDNELVVHIKPAVIEARKYEVPALSHTFTWGISFMNIRKAAHMYGWDIMPRLVSSGIWKPVYIKEIKEDLVKDVFAYVRNADVENNYALVHLLFNLSLSEDKAQDYTVKVHGQCGDSAFDGETMLYGTSTYMDIGVFDCKFWWPRNAGEQNIYTIKTELIYKGEVVDTKITETGFRTIDLVRTDTTDKDGNGDFCFVVNGKRIFALGTNWVPLDAFHSRDIERVEKAFELLYDVGCNIVRCWGGNVYESDEFYKLCDKNGILVWQDFAMACAIYPQTDEFYNAIKEEAEYVIKRLRNHPCIALWTGDNECDYAFIGYCDKKRNPDLNHITRKVLPDVCLVHDFTRPYLPSSPYISNKARISREPRTEEHLWGPRDYFKSEYYKTALCHFASEIGYHGSVSPESAKKFLPENELWPWRDQNGKTRSSWLAHAVTTADSDSHELAYRIKLMYDQVVTLFGKDPDDFETFAKQSQISQAEAKKYFIERFRIKRPKTTGVMWWNLLDGWPQFSDAVVDYYFCKKLSYFYIKRSQNPVCLMFDEPENNTISLYAVNDTMKNTSFSYKVTNITNDKVVLEGSSVANANSGAKIGEVEITDDEKKFYLIEWTDEQGATHKNHYFTNIIDIDYNAYMTAIKKCGFDQFEGF